MNCRRANLSDADLLYRWRVEGETADWYEGKPTTRAEHDLWLRQRLASPAVRIWIVEDHGTPIGVIRLDSNDELSVEIAPEWRGMGFGTKAIVFACSQAEERVKACVDGSNEAALKSFAKAGFVLRPDVDFLIWRKP